MDGSNAYTDPGPDRRTMDMTTGNKDRGNFIDIYDKKVHHVTSILLLVLYMYKFYVD